MPHSDNEFFEDTEFFSNFLFSIPDLSLNEPNFTAPMSNIFETRSSKFVAILRQQTEYDCCGRPSDL